MTFALFVVPVALLLIGFPIFVVLLTGVAVALVFFMHVPLVVVHQNLSARSTPHRCWPCLSSSMRAN
jgi:hypothetical protein